MTQPAASHARIDRKHVLLSLFVIESLLGAGIGYLLYSFYPTLGSWTLISIVLVLVPDRKDAMILAVSRIKANLVGASIGLCLFFLHPTNFLMICIGLTASILICDWLKIQEATRTATVAVLIITLHEPGKYFWEVAAERAGGVVLGCILGVLITYGFHHLVRLFDRVVRRKSEKGSPGLHKPGSPPLSHSHE
jgi:uncharacterized membrane protein YgaE (UPF0421/DUF939 family)